MISMLRILQRFSCLGWSPGQGHNILFLGKTLYSPVPGKLALHFVHNIGCCSVN